MVSNFKCTLWNNPVLKGLYKKKNKQMINKGMFDNNQGTPQPKVSKLNIRGKIVMNFIKHRYIPVRLIFYYVVALYIIQSSFYFLRQRRNNALILYSDYITDTSNIVLI